MFNPECPVILKGIGVGATPECDSGSPVVFNPECPFTLKRVGTVPSSHGGTELETIRVRPERACPGTGTRRSEGPSRRGSAPRVVRITVDGSGHIKPVEVTSPRHAFSRRSGRVNAPRGERRPVEPRYRAIASKPRGSGARSTAGLGERSVRDILCSRRKMSRGGKSGRHSPRVRTRSGRVSCRAAGDTDRAKIAVPVRGRHNSRG